MTRKTDWHRIIEQYLDDNNLFNIFGLANCDKLQFEIMQATGRYVQKGWIKKYVHKRFDSEISGGVQWVQPK